jgi:hypothetical protein
MTWTLLVWIRAFADPLSPASRTQTYPMELPDFESKALCQAARKR